MITGTVSIDDSGSPGTVSLRLASGVLVALIGSEAQRLGILNGAEVDVNGAWTILDSPLLETDVPLDPLGPTFQVDRFQVLVVGGRAAIDGLLGEDNGAYYLELFAGNRIWIKSAPSDFKSCLGKRVWVTGSVDDPPFMIGVID